MEQIYSCCFLFNWMEPVSCCVLCGNFSIWTSFRHWSHFVYFLAFQIGPAMWAGLGLALVLCLLPGGGTESQRCQEPPEWHIGAESPMLNARGSVAVVALLQASWYLCLLQASRWAPVSFPAFAKTWVSTSYSQLRIVYTLNYGCTLQGIGSSDYHCHTWPGPTDQAISQQLQFFISQLCPGLKDLLFTLNLQHKIQSAWR